MTVADTYFWFQNHNTCKWEERIHSEASLLLAPMDNKPYSLASIAQLFKCINIISTRYYMKG